MLPLVVLIFWHLGIVSTTAIQVVNGSFASSQEFYAVPWSAFIGNFTSADCASIVAPLVYVQLDEVICEPLNSTKYQGRIAFIEEFYGSRNSKFQGCPQETRYHNFVNAGAVGVVSWYDGIPGKYRELFNSGFERNMGKVPLLSIGSDFNEIAAQFIENPDLDITLQLSCEEDEYWKFWNYVKVVYFTIMGIVTVGWGCKGILAARAMRRRSKSSGSAMPATILVIEGVILLVVGGSMTLGIVGDATPSFFGYGRIGGQTRSFMYFGYAGASFWTSILVALYWQELRRALASLDFSRPIRNVLATRKGATIALVSFAMFGVSEMVAVYLSSYKHVRIPGPAISGVVAICNLIASIFFIYQAINLRKFLNDSAEQFISNKRLSKSTDIANNAANSIKENAKHCARWMQVFATFNILQIALAVPLNSAVNTRTGPGISVFLLLVTCTRNGASFAKIEALIPKTMTRSSVKSCVSTVAPDNKADKSVPLFSGLDSEAL